MDIYVGNLPYRMRSAELEQLFTGYGEVASARVIEDRMTGRSRGFGFVTMTNAEEAKKAIDELNDSEVDGRRLTVNEAQPQTGRRDRS